LFLLFITNNGIALRREDILNEIWEKKGFSASSNNLNNYVSLLRKMLYQFGLSELITTIPKYGFVFEADVVLFSEESESHSKDNIVNTDTIFSRWSGIFLFVSRKSIFFVFFVFFAISIVFFYNNTSSKPRKSRIMTNGQCHIYAVGDKAISMKENERLGIISMITNREKLDCNKNNNVYFIANDRVSTKGVHFVSYLLVTCLRESNVACENYFFKVDK
ncbi:winged helix-turn-helix domain-containing protein, partial (plasmid) [Serratia marcescens]